MILGLNTHESQETATFHGVNTLNEDVSANSFALFWLIHMDIGMHCRLTSAGIFAMFQTCSRSYRAALERFAPADFGFKSLLTINFSFF